MSKYCQSLPEMYTSGLPHVQVKDLVLILFSNGNIFTFWTPSYFTNRLCEFMNFLLSYDIWRWLDSLISLHWSEIIRRCPTNDACQFLYLYTASVMLSAGEKSIWSFTHWPQVLPASTDCLLFSFVHCWLHSTETVCNVDIKPAGRMTKYRVPFHGFSNFLHAPARKYRAFKCKNNIIPMLWLGLLAEEGERVFGDIIIISLHYWVWLRGKEHQKAQSTAYIRSLHSFPHAKIYYTTAWHV